MFVVGKLGLSFGTIVAKFARKFDLVSNLIVFYLSLLINELHMTQVTFLQFSVVLLFILLRIIFDDACLA